MANKRQHRRTSMGEDNELDMTSMIDVVFQLLVYFVVTIKPIDVSAHLDVFRPSADRPTQDIQEPPKMIRIEIFSNAFVMNGRAVSVPELTGILRKLGEFSSTQTVMIMCSSGSKHDQLITVLDRCTRAGLTNLSVVSMD
jgi:biopolymer transport protein ExbD